MKRMMPPATGSTSITVNGRSYSCAVGASIDVVDHDAGVLEANGWTASAPGGVGATTLRPANPSKGLAFHDSTLGYTIVWDGKTWRNPATGAAV